MTDYDELARLAREATPGPWEAEHIEDAVDDWWAVKPPDDAFDNVAFMGREDAAYVAAASPDVILALLKERRVLREALTDISNLHSNDPHGGMGWRDGGYGGIDPACLICGTSDEYAVPWPCATRSSADAALQERTEATR